MKRAALSAFFLLACRGQDAPVVAIPTASSAPGLAPRAPPPREEPPAATRIAITKEEARAHGRVPVAFSLDPGGTTLSATKFPEPGAYLTLSGPPGGPLVVQVFASGKEENDPAAEREDRLIREHYAKQPKFQLGERTTVTLDGAPRRAVTFVTGESLAKTGHCAVMIPFVRNVGGGDESMHTLMVVFGLGAAPPDCDQILRHPDLSRVAATFELR